MTVSLKRTFSPQVTHHFFYSPFCITICSVQLHPYRQKQANREEKEIVGEGMELNQRPQSPSISTTADDNSSLGSFSQAIGILPIRPLPLKLRRGLGLGCDRRGSGFVYILS